MRHNLTSLSFPNLRNLPESLGPKGGGCLISCFEDKEWDHLPREGLHCVHCFHILMTAKGNLPLKRNCY